MRNVSLVLFFEGPDQLRLDARIARLTAAKGVNDALGFHNPNKDIPIRIICAVRPVHGVPPDAARCDDHFVNRGRKSSWSPPLRYLMRVGPCVPNEFARRVEHPRHDDLPLPLCSWRPSFLAFRASCFFFLGSARA